MSEHWTFSEGSGSPTNLHFSAPWTPGHSSLFSLRGARQASFLAQKAIGEIHRNTGAESSSPLIANIPKCIQFPTHFWLSRWLGDGARTERTTEVPPADRRFWVLTCKVCVPRIHRNRGAQELVRNGWWTTPQGTTEDFYSSENTMSDIIRTSTWRYICLQCGRPGFDPWVGKISWRGTWQPLQGSCVENPMDRGAWQLQSIGSQRVGHDWAHACAHTHRHKHTHTRHYKFLQTHRMLNIKSEPRDSPVVQWRRLPASTAGATGSISGRGTKIMHSKWHGRKMFFEKESEHNGERGTWSDGDVLM